MPRNILVDDDVFGALQDRAEPLVDDVNSVLRRLLNLAEAERARDSRVELDGSTSLRRSRGPAKTRSKRPRAARGTLLHEFEYEIPLLKVLATNGGRAPSSEVIDAVGEALADRLLPADLEILPSGDVRWRNRVQFVRLRLTQVGDMEKGSPRGIWEISEQGRKRVQAENS